MESVALGQTGLTVGRLGLGTAYGLNAAGIQEAVEQGANFVYWGSFRRGNVPKALRALGPARRDQVVVAAGLYGHKIISSPRLARLSAERALRRLGTDHLDVLLFGFATSVPSDSMMEELVGLKDRGLVRHLGLSTHDLRLVAGLLGSPHFEVFMIRYNAANRKAEELFLPEVDPAKHGVVAFTATRWGQLLTRPAGWPADRPVPTAPDCYRYVLSHPKVSLCLTGAKNEQQLRENLAGLESGRMSEEELAWMREFGDVVYAKGRRRLRDRALS